MRRKFKRHILLPGALLIYFAIMGVVAYPRYKASGNWSEYFGIMGVSLLLALLLFFVLKRKQKIRDRFSGKDLNQ